VINDARTRNDSEIKIGIKAHQIGICNIPVNSG
ncbi:uncharacterized protein METZ01_LOCUS367371, partial [marine metagenome]